MQINSNTEVSHFLIHNFQSGKSLNKKELKYLKRFSNLKNPQFSHLKIERQNKLKVTSYRTCHSGIFIVHVLHHAVAYETR